MKRIKLFEKKTVPKTVGEIIKEHREKSGLSKEDVATFFDGNIERVNLWENNGVEPSITECKILSKLFAIPIDDMFDRVDIMPVISNATAFEKIAGRNRLAARWYE